ncbi:unnamed protein product, partial [Sphacelaria rigidula]
VLSLAAKYLARIPRKHDSSVPSSSVGFVCTTQMAITQLINAVMLLQSAGVTHNDIAPSNMTLKRLPNGSFKLTLVDLGLAQ